MKKRAIDRRQARLKTLVRHIAVSWVVFVTTGRPALAENPEPLISHEPSGRLAYWADANGNRIPDFSGCGYAGGNRAIPDAPIRMVVAPVPGDCTKRIQSAIDHVATHAPDANGLRGAVLLLRGRHEIFGGLNIPHSGVILRGQGMGDDGTTLVAAGMERRTLIRVAGRDDRREDGGTSLAILDDYVPVGETRFQLQGAGSLKPGDSIRITRPSTKEWIDFLGATDMGGGVGGGWKPGTRDIAWDREIISIEGAEVAVDAAVTTALERRFGGGLVKTFAWPGRISHIGIENLRLESKFDSANPKDENHSWCAITLDNVADAWVRQVTFQHFAGSAVAIQETGQRISVVDCLSLAPISEIGGYRRHTFFTQGQQSLFLRCYAEHGRHDFSVGHCAAGPNAFVQCEAREALDDSGPLESWAGGVLYDSVLIDGNALTLAYRPGNNAAIGWSAANCVLWNCSASVVRCWNPPGARNWSFGSWASFEGDGIWRGSNDFMKPDSLFEGQLKDRLGAEAAQPLQLMPRPREGSSNPPLDRARELAGASQQAAPQLRDYIARAGQRDPIPSEPGTARRVGDLPVPEAELPQPPSPLVLSNGWLTADGKLLIGGTANVAWWRGNNRSGEAAAFGLGVTRFVPGRIGPGLTDDLQGVASTLEAEGKVALNHNHGLWYDRRRDDHERTRRINGDVLPPFYEQPFARSGQGAAWDGLSRYDLAKFNPWYWSRLREFAAICDQRGLVLFHQNYFQHNILEAGAHWADFPWRSANNINGTGFPEPPPYAGDKRIFQAELFYDTTHPIRRKLHQGSIRQCLGNFTNQANVIQFTGAEFTGPLPFMEFWLDTIAEWLHENNRARPIIALSCTKDVQDAILADQRRNAVVDVIDFRYWWRTDQGEFAPPGGKNLAPRQFERQWRGGRPRDAHLAGMASQYRAKFPGKPLICDFETASWAWICAGGSMPRLPQTTDATLLSAIPRMRPWIKASNTGQWILREPGRQMLVYLGGNTELDLSQEPGHFRVKAVNTETGQVMPGGLVQGGRKVQLPQTSVVWITKEN